MPIPSDMLFINDMLGSLPGGLLGRVMPVLHSPSEREREILNSPSEIDNEYKICANLHKLFWPVYNLTVRLVLKLVVRCSKLVGLFVVSISDPVVNRQVQDEAGDFRT